MLCSTNNSIRQSIQFNISHLFGNRLSVKQFYLSYRKDHIRCYHSKSEWTRKQRQRRNTSHSPKVSDPSLTLILSMVIYWILVTEGVLFAEMHHHHHHEVMPSALISLTLTRHPSLSSIATSCIGPELLYVGSSWSSCLYSSMWRSPQEHVLYEFVPTSPAVSRMSGSFNLCSFCDGR